MNKSKFKILSIDGGGIRGIVPCVILKAIEARLGTPIHENFNLLAGTSTGGIITLGLNSKNPQTDKAYSAEEMLDLYRNKGTAIFSYRPKNLISWVGGFFGLGVLTDQPYDETQLESLLKAYFQDKSLKDCLSDVLVTSYDLETGRPYYFSSRLAKSGVDSDTELRIIARSTSAAPTFFNPSVIESNNKDLALADGGVFANNPSILAYAEAKELYKAHLADDNTPVMRGEALVSRGFDANVAADDNDLPFFMLSIGTGYCSKPLNGHDLTDQHSYKWLSHISDILMRGVAESTHYSMQYLLPNYSDSSKRYIRLNVPIPKEHIEMDNASPENIAALEEIANNFVLQNSALIDEICEKIKNIA